MEEKGQGKAYGKNWKNVEEVMREREACVGVGVGGKGRKRVRKGRRTVERGDY